MGNCVGKLDETEKKSRRSRIPRFLHRRKQEKENEGQHIRREQNDDSSHTTLYNLPLEVLDIVLRKSYLLWIFNSKTKPSDEEVIRSLISVDVCFYRRITRRRFKKAIWRYIEVFYRKYAERSVLRNNQKYLMENIKPNDGLLDLLLSFNCLTEEQVLLIKRLPLDRYKNVELLNAMRPFDERKVSKLIRCLRQTNQVAVERVTEFGGVVVKVKTKQRISENDKLLDQLKDHDLEILNHPLGRQSVLWIWCKSQRKLQQLQKLNESNFFKSWNIDCNQLQREIVMFPISISFVGRLNLNSNDRIYGVAKLRNAICVLCRLYSISLYGIRVFEDRNPFRLQKEIAAEEFKEPTDIVSNEKEDCLYVTDHAERCIWKITRETGDQHRIIKWLIINYSPTALSVSSEGQLLLVDFSQPFFMIYSSDAKFLRSIPLSRNIEIPLWHAVETSIGNFIILHSYCEENKGENVSSERDRKTKIGICEVSSDGQTVIRCFIPSNETQETIKPYRLLLDSDDRVFVVDTANHRVILLDFDLKWNQILCSSSEEGGKQLAHYPWSFCYDKESKQLIVGDEREVVNIYTLSRK